MIRIKLAPLLFLAVAEPAMPLQERLHVALKNRRVRGVENAAGE